MNQKALNLLIAAVLIAGIGESVYGLGQLYGIWKSHHAAFPMTGSFFNPGPYSGWLVLLFPMAVWVLNGKKASSSIIQQAMRILSWLFLFLATGVLIVTMSRAAWMAAASGCLIVMRVPIRRFIRDHRKAMRWGVPLASILLSGLLVWMFLVKKESAEGRILIWKVTSEMIAKYPVFGVGFDRFQVMYPRHQAYYFDAGRGTDDETYLAGYAEYPFNEALGWISEMGLVGFLLVFLFLGILARHWYRHKCKLSIHSFQILAGSVLITWLVFSLFSYPTEVPVLALTGILSISALVTVMPGIQRAYSGWFKQITSIAILTTILTTAIYNLYWSRQNYSIARTWISANANYQLARYSDANDIYKNELWPALQNEGDYLQIAGKSLSMARQLYPSAYYLERALYFLSDPVIFTTLGQDYTLIGKADPVKYERAEFLLKMAKNMQPGHFYPRHLLILLYQKTKQEEKLKEEAAGLLSLETKVESAAVDEMRLAAREILDETFYDIKSNTTSLKKKE